MISAWDIYFVMQLDTIGAGLMFIASLGWVPLVVAWMAVIDLFDTHWAAVTSAVAATLAWLACCVAAILIPSSKTAAAMYLIPAIANNEAIQAEASDLYKLAKQGLSRLVELPAEPVTPASGDSSPDTH